MEVPLREGAAVGGSWADSSTTRLDWMRLSSGWSLCTHTSTRTRLVIEETHLVRVHFIAIVCFILMNTNHRTFRVCMSCSYEYLPSMHTCMSLSITSLTSASLSMEVAPFRSVGDDGRGCCDCVVVMAPHGGFLCDK